jgi:transposase
METGRRKEIERHLSEAEVDAKLRDEEDPEMVRRLGFIKNLYQGDTLGEAAGREGKSQPTGARWAERWNDDGVSGLAPDHGGGRPSKLTDGERQQLRDLLEADQPWTTQDVLHLIEEEFGVTYHPNYIYELLRSFDMHDAEPRPKLPERPDDADEILEDRLDDALDSEDDDDDPVTDGG